MRLPGFIFGRQKDRSLLPNTRSDSLSSSSPRISPWTSIAIGQAFRKASPLTDPRSTVHGTPHPPGRKRKLEGPQDDSDAPAKRQKTLIPSFNLLVSGVADRHSRALPRQMGRGSVIASTERRRSLSQVGTIGDEIPLESIGKQRPDEMSVYGKCHVSEEETSPAELHREVKRLEKIAHKQVKKVHFLKEALADTKEVVNREQGDKINKLSSAGKKFEDQLNSIREHLQCHICLEALTKPHILPPCGHVFCQACLQNWFRSASRRTKKCPCCRSKVLARPIPVFVLKNLIPIVHPDKQESSQNFVADPWLDIFPPDPDVSESEGSDLIEMDDDSTSDDDDGAETATDGSGTDADGSGAAINTSDTDADAQDDDEQSSSGDEQIYEAQRPPQVPARHRTRPQLFETYLQVLREGGWGRDVEFLQSLRQRRGRV